MGCPEMLTGKYRRIFHFHLKKCGGSTLNHWLDSLTFDDRAFNGQAWRGVSGFDTKPDAIGEASEIIIPPLPRTIFHWSDVVHSHAPLRMYAPEKTFCFTVLRDPVQRLISQVSDFRRLSDSDTVDSPANVRECAEDSRRLSLRDLLEKHALRDGRSFLDNYMTRALANGRIGNLIDGVTDAERLCEIALQGLEKDYDLVGLTENLDLSRNALCAMVGLPPARKIPTINATRVAGQAELDLRDIPDILKSLTRVDYVIYERARQLFDRRHRRVAEAYDTAAFEADHAGRILGEARGRASGGATRYSVRAPLIGSGFHGRDGGGMASCAVWSGPETRTTLYIPTPPNMQLSILVWIRGYVESRQRDQLRVQVDGMPAAHYFNYADDYADLLMVDAMTTRDFVRLDIDIDETLDSGDPESETYDSRERGFAFDSYGWRPIV
jgi:hypothetical protein